MSLSAFLSYIQSFSSQIPLGHWCVITIVSLLVTLLTWKKFHRYGAIVLGITVFLSLIVLDAAVLIRFCDKSHHVQKYTYKVKFDWLVSVSDDRRIEIVSNFIAFIPLGFFLSEFLSEARQFNPWRWIGYVALSGFCFSLCVESLQIILRVGVFDLTDLLMNTLGTFVGGSMAIIGRSLLVRLRVK